MISDRELMKALNRTNGIVLKHIAELEKQIVSDTQRFKEMEQHGLELEAENARLRRALDNTKMLNELWRIPT